MRMQCVRDMYWNRIVIDLMGTQKNDAVVHFTRGSTVHSLKIGSDCPPEVFAKMLNTAKLRADKSLGSLVAEFIRAAAMTTKVDIIGSGEEDWKVAYNYTVITFGGPVTYNVQIVDQQADAEGRTTFIGSINQFWEWVKTYRAPSDLRGKLVKFYYNGGTLQGNRIVKVDEVKGTADNNFLIVGMDVMKEEFRSFRLDRIQGDLILVS